MTSTHQSELGSLADADCFSEALDLTAVSQDDALSYYSDMLKIRFAEEKIGEWAENGQTRTPCHLGIGQEAIAVGISSCLNSDDRVFGGHRSHSHYLALGGDLYGLMAEVLGKKDGACKGMGGSMHLTGRDVGFGGSVPIVGATIPIAVGAGLASKMDKNKTVAVSYFGDGAAEEGVLHESLNLARVLNLPVLFVCENNFLSSHLHIELRQPSDRVSRYADAHLIENVLIDGNDVVGVAAVTRDIVQRMRNEGGPTFIEAVTYRHRGHVGPREDIDVGVRRSMQDLNRWKNRDPITRMEAALVNCGFSSAEQIKELQLRIKDEIAQVAHRAEAADFPDTGQLMDMVYG